MKPTQEALLAGIATALHERLGDNLHACCVYGSAVRGNSVEGVSDLNLLVVLERSTAEAHDAIARTIAPHPQIDPFILARSNFARTARCFATKFASIRRHMRVLRGVDPFAGMAIDHGLERLLCEQGLRNLRLRLTYAFVMRGPKRNFGRFLQGCISPIFVQLSDVARLSGEDVPSDFAERVPVIGRTCGTDPAVLHDLIELRQHPRVLPDAGLGEWHARVLTLLDAALATIERTWPDPAARAS